MLTFSDGRDFVHEGAGVGKFARDVEDDIAGALEAAGHEVVRARELVWTNRLAVNEARRVADARPDLTVFNIPVWAFPHFSMLAANETPGPLLLFSNINPEQPGMVGMLAAAGGLDQIGQILKSLSGTPVLFANVRHYHADRDVWDLCNSGQHATWFAARSDDPAENMRHVHLYPEEFFFPAGGAAVHHLAAEGDFTFARLTRHDGHYRMHVLRGSFVRFDDETNEDLMRQSTYAWPHAFAKMDAEAEEILSRYGSNHIHAIPGDHVEELRVVCDILGMDYDGFGEAA
jgi:L-fucose isomerase-like protein